MTKDALNAAAGSDVDISAPDRLALIAQMNLSGHLSHPDLEAVVSTLVARCRVPIAVINIVTPDLQTPGTRSPQHSMPRACAPVRVCAGAVGRLPV